MKNGKIIALLLIILFLTAVALVVTWAVQKDTGYESPLDNGTTATDTKAPSADGNTTAPAVPTPEATIPPQNTVAPTTVPIITPVPTAVPTSTPEPTPAPVVVDVAPTASEGYGASMGSGTFSGDSGTVFNLNCKWSAKTLNANEVTLTVTVYATSWSLYTCSLPCTVTAGSLQGQFNAPAISYDGSSGAATHELGSKSFTYTLPAGSSITVPVSVSWAFRGTYSGVSIENLTASTTITLSR